MLVGMHEISGRAGGGVKSLVSLLLLLKAPGPLASTCCQEAWGHNWALTLQCFLFQTLQLNYHPCGTSIGVKGLCLGPSQLRALSVLDSLLSQYTAVLYSFILGSQSVLQMLVFVGPTLRFCAYFSLTCNQLAFNRPFGNCPNMLWLSLQLNAWLHLWSTREKFC